MSDADNTARRLSAKARLNSHSIALSERIGLHIHSIAIYGSLALIAAIVFGAFSAPPL